MAFDRDNFFTLARRPQGTVCPCCDRFAKVYEKRTVHTGCAMALIDLYHRMDADVDSGWVYLPKNSTEEGTRSRSISHATYFGLVRNRPKVLGEKLVGRCTGYWRLTPDGVAFVENATTIHRYAEVYNNTVNRLHGPMVSIRRCLGKKFNYDELMGA